MKNKISPFRKLICVIIAVIIAIPSAFSVPVEAKSNFTVGQDCVDLIKETEGFSKYKYEDYGQYSIGYGTRCDPDAYPNGITEEEAEQELRKFAKAFGDYVNSYANKNNITLTQNQFDALVCFTYALGYVFDAYSDVELEEILINGSENYSFFEIADAFAVWRKAGGKVLPGLVRRRQREIQLFLKNRTEPDAEVWRVDSEDGLNLRAKPDTSAEKTGYYVEYKIFSVTEKVKGSDGSIWGKTLYEGKEQWCSLKYCTYYVGGPLPIDGVTQPVVTTQPNNPSVDPPAAEPASETWRITSDDGVNLRSGPGLSYGKIGFIDYKTEIKVTEKIKVDGYQWGKTNINGKNGWCVLDYAELVSSQQIVGSTLKSIYIDSKPKKIKYIEGENLDTAGMVVMAVYSDGTERKVSDYEVSGFESNAGTYHVTVSYMKKTAMFTVTVGKREMIGIEIAEMPSKLVYKTGEGLSIKGMKVNGVYEGNVTLEINNFYLEGVDGFSETPGEKTITVSSGEFTAEFKVQVTEKVITSIEITSLPTITDYVLGQALNTDGMVVHAIFNNGRKNAVTNYTVSGYDPRVLGEQLVIVAYNGFKDTFVVNVSDGGSARGLMGDLDGNGNRDVFDLVILNKVISGEVKPDKEQAALTDVNLDGYTDQKDVEALSYIISQQAA